MDRCVVLTNGFARIVAFNGLAYVVVVVAAAGAPELLPLLLDWNNIINNMIMTRPINIVMSMLGLNMLGLNRLVVVLGARKSSIVSNCCSGRGYSRRAVEQFEKCILYPRIDKVLQSFESGQTFVITSY